MPTARFMSDREWLALAPLFWDSSFEQSLTYGQAAASRIGGTLRPVLVEDGTDPLAIALARIKAIPGLGRGIAWIPSGPMTHRRDRPPVDQDGLAQMLQALRGLICQREGHILRLRLPALAQFLPEVTSAAMARAGFQVTTRALPYHTALMDLTLDDDRLMAALHHKWRTNLRHALKAGMQVEAGDTPDLRARFLTMYHAMRAAKGFHADITPEFHFGLSGPDYHLNILVIHKDGVDVAGSVSVMVGDSSDYLFAATPEVGRDLRAGYLLTWESILQARRRGARAFDIGGIDIKGDNPEVARFKERLNGTPASNEAYEADGGGPVPKLIRGLESLRLRMKGGKPAPAPAAKPAEPASPGQAE